MVHPPLVESQPPVPGSLADRENRKSGYNGDFQQQGRRLVDDVDPRAEDISRAALGTDVARFRRIAFQLAPQPQDLA